MRHAHRFLQLNTPYSRSQAAHLVMALLEHEQIQTTVNKAKVASRMADRMITLGKKGTLAARRQAAKFLGDGPALKKLFSEIGKKYQERPGGFTRMIRAGMRQGDGAPMAILELIDRTPKPITTDKKGKDKKKADLKAPAKAAASK